MQIASIGSGSRGNGTLVEDQAGLLLIDCGFTIAQVEARMQRLGRHPSELNGILVTHEHADHAYGVGTLARQFDVPVYLTAGTARSLNLRGCNVEVISSHRPFVAAGFEVEPVVVPHDAREPVQFILRRDGIRFGLLTDAGHITPFMVDRYRDCDALMLECNHDPNMLWSGRYPVGLKRRVGGPHGHLNNRQAADFLCAVATERLRWLVLAHLSESNNTPENAMTGVQNLFTANVDVHLATQDTGFEWLSANA